MFLFHEFRRPKSEPKKPLQMGKYGFWPIFYGIKDGATLTFQSLNLAQGNSLAVKVKITPHLLNILLFKGVPPWSRKKWVQPIFLNDFFGLFFKQTRNSPNNTTQIFKSFLFVNSILLFGCNEIDWPLAILWITSFFRCWPVSNQHLNDNCLLYQEILVNK